MTWARGLLVGIILVAIVALAALVLPGPGRGGPDPSLEASGTPRSVGPTVFSVADLRRELADNSVTDITVANGTYVVPDASSITGQVSGLWIDQRFAARTNAVLVHAETTGGVTISGGGATDWIGLAFRDGVHDQTWQGLRFANAEPTQTGVIVFGQSGSVTPIAPHDITLRDMTIEETITSDNPPGMSGDHAVYFSRALTPGVHDILIDGLTVNASTSGLDSAIQFYGSAPGAPNANNVTIRHLRVTGTDQAVIFWDATIHDIVIEDSTISGAKQFAVRYELGHSITLRRVSSTGSGRSGFYSSLGANPPGVTLEGVDLAQARGAMTRDWPGGDKTNQAGLDQSPRDRVIAAASLPPVAAGPHARTAGRIRR